MITNKYFCAGFNCSAMGKKKDKKGKAKHKKDKKDKLSKGPKSKCCEKFKKCESKRCCRCPHTWVQNVAAA